MSPQSGVWPVLYVASSRRQGGVCGPGALPSSRLRHPRLSRYRLPDGSCSVPQSSVLPVQYVASSRRRYSACGPGAPSSSRLWHPRVSRYRPPDGVFSESSGAHSIFSCRVSRLEDGISITGYGERRSHSTVPGLPQRLRASGRRYDQVCVCQ